MDTLLLDSFSLGRRCDTRGEERKVFYDLHLQSQQWDKQGRINTEEVFEVLFNKVYHVRSHNVHLE